MKQSIFQFSCQEFQDFISNSLEEKGRQHAEIFWKEWFKKGVAVTRQHPAFNTAKSIFETIIQATDLTLPAIASFRSDGATGKILIKTYDDFEIETIAIPMARDGTLCVSSQIGCRMGCAFCETGRMGLLRNLTISEILSQVFIARFILGCSFRNIVFMGMGEPFDNYEQVMRAIDILCDQRGLAFGRHRITVSTSGRLDGIKRLTEEGGKGINLAVSINAPTDDIRSRLMPINRKDNMHKLYEAMKEYCSSTKKQILVAYVLLKGINDTIEHAQQLAEYLKGLDVKVNLIPYNQQSVDRYQSVDGKTVDEFAHFLRLAGYQTLVRKNKGRQIMAACGQLGNIALKKKLVVHQVNGI